nr:transposase [Paraburkholderia youngii]
MQKYRGNGKRTSRRRHQVGPVRPESAVRISRSLWGIRRDRLLYVSNMYIALFRHFIPFGVHEVVYILDGLILNGADVKPDTIHDDTQAQSGPVFGLSYVVGINLMPHMRNIKDLVLYEADRLRKYKHIDSLCRQAVNRPLIERQCADMMRVAVSIKAGKMTPSTVLRRLGSESTKNKLHFTFRELGQVTRTLFQLNISVNQTCVARFTLRSTRASSSTTSRSG